MLKSLVLLMSLQLALTQAQFNFFNNPFMQMLPFWSNPSAVPFQQPQLAAPTPQAAATTPSPLPPAAPQKLCAFETNVEYLSNDLNVSWPLRLEQCCGLCYQTELCQTWSYDQITQICILKKANRSSSFIRLAFNMISGVRAESLVPPPPSPPPTPIPPIANQTNSTTGGGGKDACGNFNPTYYRFTNTPNTTCPDVPRQVDLVWQRFAGDWLYFMRSDNNAGNKCNRVSYKYVNETIMQTNYTLWTNKTKSFESSLGTLKYDGSPGTYMSNDLRYVVVDTDYTRYALVFLCNEAAADQQQQQSLYLLRRDLNLDPIVAGQYIWQNSIGTKWKYGGGYLQVVDHDPTLCNAF